MNSKKFNLYILCLILLILDGAHSLFTFVYLPGFRTFLGLLTICLFWILYPSKKKMTFPSLLIYLFTVIGFVISYRGNVLSSFIAQFPVLTLFLLKRRDLKIVAEQIDKFFFIIISISIVLYLFSNLLNVPIPYQKVIYNQYDIQNYYYLYTNSIRYGYRFTGFTLEPGYFSLLCICLLALNEFKFNKKSSYIYVIAILFSLSLEGYLLLITGFIISTICREGRVSETIKYTIIIIGAIVIGIYIALNYNGGNNVVGEYIIERLVLDDEKGIVGNNRESLAAEIMIDPVFYSDRIWFGIGAKEYYDLIKGLDMCSWRSFVLVHGAIYSIFLFIITLLGLSQTIKRKTFPFFLIFWIDFFPHGGPFYEVMYFMILIFLLNLKSDKLMYFNNNLLYTNNKK